MYILDTDHLSLLGRASSPEAQRLRFRLVGLNLEERVTTIITFEEQMRGWMSHLVKARSLAHEVVAYRRLKEFLDRYLASVHTKSSPPTAQAAWVRSIARRTRRPAATWRSSACRLTFILID